MGIVILEGKGRRVMGARDKVSRIGYCGTGGKKCELVILAQMPLDMGIQWVYA